MAGIEAEHHKPYNSVSQILSKEIWSLKQWPQVLTINASAVSEVPSQRLHLQSVPYSINT